MPSDDLKAYATSTTDFYGLLGVTFETSQHDIDRGFRKTALKYHPDKVGTDPIAKEKFHLAKIGHEILSDPSLKVLYDNSRTARDQKRKQNELFTEKRKVMKDNLESKERGLKRGREEDESIMELRRLAEDGKRRRELRNEALIKELKSQDEQQSQQPPISTVPITPNPTITPISPITSTNTPSPDISQKIRVRGSPAMFSTSTGSPFRGGSGGAGSPSLLEATMLRLKEAEKRRAAAAKAASQAV